jgi:hypothetical protein
LSLSHLTWNLRIIPGVGIFGLASALVLTTKEAATYKQ